MSVMFVVGIIAMIAGLLLSVAVHELGHMIPAKRFGVFVPVYSVGFGPVLWRKKVGETEYRVSALPFGGYVQLAGMFPPGQEGRRTHNRRGRLTLAEDARRSSARSLPEGGQARAFYHLAPWQKFIVMVGGPLTNLVLAAVCFSIAFVGIGHPVASPTLDTLSPTIKSQSGQAPNPAIAAGIHAGDTILKVGDYPIEAWRDVSEAMDSASGAPIRVVVDRAGEELSFDVSPVERHPGDWVLGVRAGTMLESQPWSMVSQVMWASVEGMAKMVVALPVKVWEAGRSVVSGEQRDQDGLVSVVGVARMGGELTSTALEHERLSLGLGLRVALAVAGLLTLVGSLNMALFIFNLLPLPPLDGGHIFAAVYEAARAGFARLRGRPRPARVDTARLMPVTYTVGVCLVVMMLVGVVADIVNPISLGR